jgi:dipeptidyl aminopeptidase/acylaminoacyl peptidase
MLAACLVALVGNPGPAGAAFPGENGKISYVVEHFDINTGTAHRAIYSMNPDGSNQTNLTNTTNGDLAETPAWSPDGSKIAFISLRDSIYDIFIMNADGTNQTRITNPMVERDPTWSPDGTKIAFSGSQDANEDIYTMNADGSNPVRLTTDPADDTDPTWSPDGTKIAFSTDRNEGVHEIYTMNADGSNQTDLTNLPNGGEFYADWSPDGTKIAFSGSDIYTINTNGTNLTRLTDDIWFDHGPAWSPDGTKIAFSSDLNNGVYEIYTMNADGSNRTRLTDTPQSPGVFTILWGELSWQPIPVVDYSFSGFYQPVDNLPTLNKTKAGKTIPIRFRLGGDKGLDIFATGYPRSEAINCETGALTDDIEQTVLGKSGLTYDPVSDRYTYNWATSSSWSGCRQFVMTLKDGTTHRANFTFK